MSAVDKLNKLLGKEVASYGDKLDNVEFLKTGLPSLDLAIGGGFPKGRIVVMKGLESTAKTSLALNFIAKCQKDGIKCAFVDAEYAFNPEHAEMIGVDLESLLMLKCETGEEVFEATETMLRDNMAKVIVIDSVSALTPRPEAEAEYGHSTMGSQARLISQGMRKIIAPLANSDAVLIFINQLRKNIMGGQWDPFTESGGMALKYYTSVALRLTKKKSIIVDKETLGIEVEVKVTKNKVGTPFGQCLLNYRFEEGWSDTEDLIEVGLKADVIQREGNTYKFEGKQLATGKAKASDFIDANPDLKAKILSRLGLPQESQSSEQS